MKQFYFLAGLPRSGSTLLASVLSENPAFYTSPNSVLLELMFKTRAELRASEQAQAFMQPTQERDVLRALMQGMYTFSNAQHIVDKSRSWPHPENIAMLKEVLGEEPKIIATVRSLPDVLTSFVSLIEAHPEARSYVDTELVRRGLPLTVENRCNILFSPEGTVYEPWYTLKMALDAGLSRNIHLVEYEDLVAKPQEVLNSIYQFLGVVPFAHNLSAIVNKTPENDAVYGIPGFHQVRPILAKTSRDPVQVLGPELAARYAAVPHFWRANTTQTSTASTNPFTLRT